MLGQTQHLSLSGKTAIISGGGRGIGAGCAFDIANRGADVFFVFYLLTSSSPPPWN